MKVLNKKNILCIILGISFLSIILCILLFTKYNFNSDCATYILLAKEQIKYKSWFPKGFYYSTEIFTFSINLLLIPFMLIFNNGLACREAGVIVAWILVILLIFLLFKNKEKKSNYEGFIACILVLLPTSGMVMDMYFYQAAYVQSLVFVLIFLNVAKMLISISDDKKTNKNTIIKYLIYFLAIIAINLGGMRFQLLVCIPAIMAYIVLCIMKNDFSLQNSLKDTKLLKILIVTMLGSVFGGISYKLLSAYVGFIDCMSYSTFISDLFSQFGFFCNNVALIYGITATSTLICIQSIYNCFIFVWIIFCSIFVPMFLLKNLKNINSLFYKYLIIYSNISNGLTIFFMVFTTMKEERYFLPVYFNNILLVALYIGWLIKNLQKSFSLLIIAGVACVVMLSHVNYYVNSIDRCGITKNDFEEIFSPHANDEIINFLKDNNLTYGFASYWNAYDNMSLSNGKLTIVSWASEPKDPNYWLASKDWYDVNEHTGKCFILLANGEYIDEKYYEIADNILYCNGYTILVYSKNIYLYDEFSKTTVYQSINENYSIDLASLSVKDNAYKLNNKIGLKQSGLQYGPYINLKAGKYCVTIKGDNLNSVNVKVTAFSGTEIILINDIMAEEKSISYKFSLSNDSENVEFVNQNIDVKEADITQITISKEKE